MSQGPDSAPVPITIQEIRDVIREHQTRRTRAHRDAWRFGEVGYLGLTEHIAIRWKCLDAQSREILEHHARVLRDDYRKEFAVLNQERNRAVRENADPSVETLAQYLNLGSSINGLPTQK